MAVTSPPSITALPTVPDPNDRATFNARAYPWSVAIGVFSTEVAAVGTNVYNNAVAAAASASTAGTHSSNASDYATAALGSAIAASGSASTASTQAANVLTMDKRYLGSFASPPSVDNQGAALATGAVYYDSTNVLIKTWTGSAWIAGITSISGVSTVNGMNGAVTIAIPPAFVISGVI